MGTIHHLKFILLQYFSNKFLVISDIQINLIC